MNRLREWLKVGVLAAVLVVLYVFGEEFEDT